MAKQQLPPELEDDFDEGVALDWLSRNFSSLLTVVTIGIIAIGGYFGYQTWQASGNEDLTARYSEAASSYARALGEPDEAKRRDTLSGSISLADSFAGTETPLKRQGLLLAGNAAFALSECQKGDQAKESLKKAVGYFERFFQSAQENDEKAAAQLAIGNAYENLLFVTRDLPNGDLASKAYKEASRFGKGGPLDMEARLGLARLTMAQAGRQNEAKAILESVIADSAKQNDSLARQMRKELPTTLTLVGGVTVDQAELEKLRSASGLTYATLAEASLRRLPALPTTLGPKAAASETTGTK